MITTMRDCLTIAITGIEVIPSLHLSIFLIRSFNPGIRAIPILTNPESSAVAYDFSVTSGILGEMKNIGEKILK